MALRAKAVMPEPVRERREAACDKMRRKMELTLKE